MNVISSIHEPFFLFRINKSLQQLLSSTWSLDAAEENTSVLLITLALPLLGNYETCSLNSEAMVPLANGILLMSVLGAQHK